MKELEIVVPRPNAKAFFSGFTAEMAFMAKNG